MKLKTSELTGNTLDFAVMMGVYPNGPPNERFFGFKRVGFGYVPKGFHPSSDPEQAHQIMEAHKIGVWPTISAMVAIGYGRWSALCYYGDNSLLDSDLVNFEESFGSNISEAAMRAYVFYKFGEEIELPDELV